MRTTGFASCFAFILFSALLPAQNPVTTTSTGTAGTVPVFTTGTNVENSPIAVSGSSVGIGTPNPAAVLDVLGNALLGNSQRVWVEGLQPAPDYGAAVYLVNDLGQSQGAVRFRASYDGVGTNGGANFSIDQSTTAQAYGNDPSTLTYASRFVIDGVTGDVGVGTTSPAYKLDVAGQIRSSSGGIVFPDGTTQTTAFNPALCGGDYAESVDVTGKRAGYEPGDVLVIDPEASGKFLKSAKPYSTLVAGVYSTKPGTVGRRQTSPKSPDEVPMALVGIVPVKVTAENGPTKPGDLLVTSSTPGRAMKGTYRDKMQGAVIGKALGLLDSGNGVVEVLVTLQ